MLLKPWQDNKNRFLQSGFSARFRCILFWKRSPVVSGTSLCISCQLGWKQICRNEEWNIFFREDAETTVRTRVHLNRWKPEIPENRTHLNCSYLLKLTSALKGPRHQFYTWAHMDWGGSFKCYVEFQSHWSLITDQFYCCLHGVLSTI